MPLSPAQFREKGHGKTGPWVDLVNSEEWDTYGKRTDWLDDPSWSRYFLRQWNFPPPTSSAFPAKEFRALRAALRKSCEALFDRRKLSSEEIRGFNDRLKVVGKRQLIERPTGLQVEFVPQSNGWEWILAETALSFANLLAGAARSRIKICLNSDCRWVFYDSTKGRTRRWCSDKVCGNRDRVRRARARMSN